MWESLSLSVLISVCTVLLGGGLTWLIGYRTQKCEKLESKVGSPLVEKKSKKFEDRKETYRETFGRRHRHNEQEENLKAVKSIFVKGFILTVLLNIFTIILFQSISRTRTEKINLGDIFPNFEAKTTVGSIKFHDWLGNSWGVLFSHPADFTPVCTTELARMVQLDSEFEKRGVKVIALSCDSVESHKKWLKDIKMYAGYTNSGFPYPIIADEDRKLATQLQMIDPDEKDASGIPLTARAVFIVDPNKRIRLSILYPATTGRNFNEILRVIDSLQLTDKHRVATPVDWKPQEDVMIQPSVSEEEVKTLFSQQTVVKLPSGKNYVRKTPHP